jgi:hypothetical protein
MDMEAKECLPFIVFPSERLAVKQKRVFGKKIFRLSTGTL